MDYAQEAQSIWKNSFPQRGKLKPCRENFCGPLKSFAMVRCVTAT